MSDVEGALHSSSKASCVDLPEQVMSVAETHFTEMALEEPRTLQSYNLNVDDAVGNQILPKLRSALSPSENRQAMTRPRRCHDRGVANLWF
jgi:hypothetical protein